MVGFSDDLRAETKTAHCNIADLRSEMDGVDVAEFDAAMDDVEAVPSNAIDRAVKRGAYETAVGVRSIKKHRRRTCSCFDTEATS